MNLKQLFWGIVILSASSCTSEKNFIKYSTDYVEVGKIMDSVKLPYTIQLNKGKKQLLAIGVSHTYDYNNPQIEIIRQKFQNFNPDITINEGGQINKIFPNEIDAVTSNGEVGLLKYLSDSNSKGLINGDIEDSLEFKIMLRKYSADDLLLYYIMERLIVPHLNGAYHNQDINELYEKAIQKWFIQENFPVNENWKTFIGFKKLYNYKIGHNLELTINPDIELFDYVNPNCKYCEIGRESKIVRDSVLLEKIQSELKSNERVMVVFGHGHILAIEPALKKMMIK